MRRPRTVTPSANVAFEDLVPERDASRELTYLVTRGGSCIGLRGELGPAAEL
jgi:hypothetical protein